MPNKMPITRRQTLLALSRWASLGLAWCGTAALATHAQPAAANPVRLIPADAKPNSTIDHFLINATTHRKVGLRIRLPAGKEKTGLIIYSPGLGSGLNNGAPWCDAWRRAGFIVVTLSHPVTNDDIWDTRKKSLKDNLREALAFPQYGLRVTDCKFVIDACLQDPDLESLIDPERIGIAGHSYGALTVQSIAGQSHGRSQGDSRIKAAIAFSPTAATAAAATGMRTVKIPFFCIMGDKDNHVTFKNDTDAMRLGVDLSKRKTVYQGLPPGKREQLIVANADHMSFAGENLFEIPARFSRDINATPEQDSNTWEKISQVTTLFWLAHLRTSASDADLKKYRDTVRDRLGPGDDYVSG
jgi:predicted dienelactone hydrolase